MVMVCPFSVANIQIFFQLATLLPHLFVVFVAGGHFNGSCRMDISGARALSGLWLGGAPLGQRVLLMGPRCQRPVAGAHAFTQLMKLVVAADVPSSSAVVWASPLLMSVSASVVESEVSHAVRNNDIHANNTVSFCILL